MFYFFAFVWLLSCGINSAEAEMEMEDGNGSCCCCCWQGHMASVRALADRRQLLARTPPPVLLRRDLASRRRRREAESSAAASRTPRSGDACAAAGPASSCSSRSGGLWEGRVEFPSGKAARQEGVSLMKLSSSQVKVATTIIRLLWARCASDTKSRGLPITYGSSSWPS